LNFLVRHQALQVRELGASLWILEALRIDKLPISKSKPPIEETVG
jgi:hypothetical protein